MDELEDGEEVLREVIRGEDEEGRSSTSSSGHHHQQGRRSPGEEGGSRTVSPLSKLKVTNLS